MGVFTGYQPRKNLYKNREGSSLVSYRERNSVLHGWKSDRAEAFRADKSGQMLLQVRQELARASRRSANNLGMYPFKIYQFPDSLRTCQVSNSYRRIKVRNGQVMPPGTISFPAIGSDSVGNVGLSGPFEDSYLGSFEQIPPSTSALVVSDGLTSTWNEFLVAEDDFTYVIWFSFALPHNASPGGYTSIPYYGLAACKVDDPANAVLLNTGETFDATNVWPTIPINDLYNYAIGTVIFNSTADALLPKGLYIKQYQYGNINLPGSPLGTSAEEVSNSANITLNWRGTYSNTSGYYVGDVVTITYADASTVSSLWQYVYDPKSTSVYSPPLLRSPMTGVSPNGNSPDPWKLLSKSPSAADYHNGAYDASKFYLRTA